MSILGLILGLLVLVTPASGSDLCIHSAVGEGYDGAHHVNTVGYSTEGEPCRWVRNDAQTFRLSASDEDPDVNSGELGEPVLFLWAIAGTGYGFWNGYAFYDGALAIQDVQPMNDATVDWTIDPPRLNFVRPRLPFDLDARLPIARLTVSAPSHAEADTWGGIKALYR